METSSRLDLTSGLAPRRGVDGPTAWGVLLVLAAGIQAGCGADEPPPHSPIALPGSDEFRKAQAQDEWMARKNQAAEAKFRRRRPGLLDED